MSDAAFSDDPSPESSATPPDPSHDQDVEQLLERVSKEVDELVDDVGQCPVGAGDSEPPVDESESGVDGPSESIIAQVSDVEVLVSMAKNELVEDPPSESAVPPSSGLKKTGIPIEIGDIEVGPPAAGTSLDEPLTPAAGSKSALSSELALSESEETNGAIGGADVVGASSEHSSEAGRASSAWVARLKAGTDRSVDLALNVLDLVDRPFGWLSVQARGLLGWAALVTLTAALALWILSFVTTSEAGI